MFKLMNILLFVKIGHLSPGVLIDPPRMNISRGEYRKIVAAKWHHKLSVDRLPPGWTFPKVGTEKLQLQSHFRSWGSIDPPSRMKISKGGYRKVAVAKSLRKLRSWGSIDPPRMNISKGGYRKVAVAKSLQKLRVDRPPQAPRMKISKGGYRKVAVAKSLQKLRVEGRLTPPPGWTFPKVGTEKLQLQSHFKSWLSIDPPPGWTFQRWVQKSCSCKVTSKVECRSTPPGWTFPKVGTEKLQLQSHFKSWVSIEHPPQDEHFQRWVQKSCSCKVTSKVECWSTPQDEHFQRWVQKSCSCKVTSKVECQLTPPRMNIPKVGTEKLQLQSHFKSWVSIRPSPPPPGWTFPKVGTEKLQLQSHFKSWGSIDPPQDEHFQRLVQKSCSCKVTSKVECWSTPPRMNISKGGYRKVADAKSLQKLSVNRPPQDEHSKGWYRKVAVAKSLQKLSVNQPSPPPGWTFPKVGTEKLQLQSHFKSWVSIDPPRMNISKGWYRKVAVAKSLQKLSVDQPPPPRMNISKGGYRKVAVAKSLQKLRVNQTPPPGWTFPKVGTEKLQL